MWAENGIDKEHAGSFVQTNVWTCMLCHFVCNWDWLSVWAWQFEFLVTKIDCVQLCSWVCWYMSGTPCLIKPASHRHSILEVSYSLTPLDATRVTNLILYLFCLPPSLPPLSLSVTLPLSNTYSTSSLYFKFFLFLKLRFFHGARETSSVILKNWVKVKYICICLHSKSSIFHEPEQIKIGHEVY